VPELASPTRSHGLVDVLDRVLDKGLVIAGDIKINLANVELLTIQVRLLVCSIDKAEQIGLNWWRSDPRLTMSPAGSVGAGHAGAVTGADTDVERRLARIERQLEQLIGRSGSTTAAIPPTAASSSSAAGGSSSPSSPSSPHAHGRP
jgi:hypothetical protein